ncbi:MAG TPA: DUF1343 domain-containing protein [Thermoanaerobaculia bacterium]|nr:DUF1343 domain-containing protein [Thermoanaerobaculia bacterium]
MILTGLDRLLADPAPLRGRRYGLLSHIPSVTAELVPAHVALAAIADMPQVLFGPEHGYYGVEQDMVPSEDQHDPWTGVLIRSLYGSDPDSLRPTPDAFRGLDLLLVDLQDVGSRYYTYCATALWAVEGALAAGCEVWVLDRPNPLGGEVVEGNLLRPGFASFVGAFPHPVRHGLTLGEVVTLELRRGGRANGWRVWEVEGWRREMLWPQTGRPWIAPSPNMPSFATALVYPGMCLVEGTRVSEGRGTTRPFQLLGAPHLDPMELVRRLDGSALPGVRFVPTYFRPQYQKHAGRHCGGVEVVVTDPAAFRPYRTGVEVLAVLAGLTDPAELWRREPYEFVSDRPAIDLLAGSDALRQRLDAGDGVRGWVESWSEDERRFRDERQGALLYG